MPQGSVTRRQFAEPEELLDAVPGVGFQITPLERSSFGVALMTFELGDVTLQVGRSSPFIGFASPAPGRAVLQLPLENVETLVLNGTTCRTGMFVAYGPGAELLRANPQPCLHSMLAFSAEAVDALLDLPAGSPHFRPGAFVPRQAGPAVWHRASAVIRAAADTAAAFPKTFDHEQARHALRDSLLRAARELVSDQATERVTIRRSSGARRRIVSAADEYLQLHKDRPIYTDELCEALATSPSALAEAFRSIFLTSPHRFLKLRRLSMVRSALRTRAPEAPLVKTVALSHGFWHLGQFAQDYRATFGESPSDTVARNRG